MKRHKEEEAEPEYQLLGACVKHEDIWSQILTRFTVVDLLVLRNVSLELKTALKDKLESPLCFHFLGACRRCGHQSYMTHTCNHPNRPSYGYDGNFYEANGICQGWLSFQKICSEYEEEVMTRDFSCVLQQ